MRIKRQKQFRREWEMYKINLGLFQPYNIIIDGNFIKVALSKGMNIYKYLSKLLVGKIKLYTTKCIINELEKLGTDFEDVQNEANKMFKEKCQHSLTTDPMTCIINLIGINNSKKYILATQDEFLRKKLRLRSEVPILFFDGDQLQWEEVPEKLQKNIEKKEITKYGPSEQEKIILKPVQEQIEKEYKDKFKKLIKKERNSAGIKLKRKANGPNPLSLLPKKKKKLNNDE